MLNNRSMARREHCGLDRFAPRLALAATLIWAWPAWAQAGDEPEQTAPAETVEPAPSEGFEWYFHWKDWEGLSYFASQPTRIKASVKAAPLLDLQHLRLAGTFGGRLEVDGAAYSTGGTLAGFDDGFELRRARITAKGASIFAVPFSYRVDLGYVPGKFTVTQAYIQIAGIRYLGDLQFGQFTPPLGLQLITSSWDIGFMEPAAPLQALAPSSQPGVQLHDSFLESRGTWTFGAYGDLSMGGEYGSDASGFRYLMGRLTWLAVDHTDDSSPAANRYLHLGASGSAQRSTGGVVRSRSRPESYLAPYVIDTGDIDASSARGGGLELLWVNGPFNAQFEIVGSQMNSNTDGLLKFYGGYAQVSWFLTGESRPYDRGDGAPGRVVPRSNFGFGPNAGWGALEAAARLSYTDLSDGSVHGGRLTMFMTSLNWRPRPQLKCMFELGAGRVSDTASSGNIVQAQLRMGVYLY